MEGVWWINSDDWWSSFRMELQLMLTAFNEAEVPPLPMLLPVRLVKTDACAIFLVPGESPVDSE